jgi:hypothetical protein
MKTLLIMMMMIVLPQLATAEEELWELVLVTKERMIDMPQKFNSHKSCVKGGTASMEFAKYERELLLGYICEEEEVLDLPWELLMFNVDGVLVLDGNYATYGECLRTGSRRITHQLVSGTGDSGDRVNPYRYNGFKCNEEPKPNSVSRVVPKCLQPMKECA